MRRPIILFIAFAFLGRALRAAPPATRPSVPPLIAGSANPPHSFIVNGYAAIGKSGVSFRVAVDGQKQICLLCDRTDSTPLFLSDGNKTLFYDLENDRVVLVHDSSGVIRLDWEPASPHPFRFHAGAGAKLFPSASSQPAVAGTLPASRATTQPEPSDNGTAFRIDHFTDAPQTKFESVEPPPGGGSMFASRRHDYIDFILINPRDPSWFRYVAVKREDRSFAVLLRASHIGKPLPQQELAFPDIKALGQSVPLVDLDAQMASRFLSVIANGHAWLYKFAIAGGPELRKHAESLLPKVDWDELARQDAELGKRYRDALKSQHIALPEGEE